MTSDFKGVAAIEWTDRTWNPVAGCSYHHEGCRNCYAVPMAVRQEGMNNGAKSPGTRAQYAGLVERNIALPSDIFHENMDDRWLTDIWETMVACPHHNSQVLTKRPNRALRKIKALRLQMTPNIWLGASICENKFARIMVRDLERFSAGLNHRGFTRRPFSDSRSVLAKEAGTNGSSFIA